MKLIAIAIVMMMCGCSPKPLYYRQDVPGYTYFREYHPTTFHGFCANVYGGGNAWEADHPYGHAPSKHGDGQITSTGTETRIFKTQTEALTWAESVCPTK